MEEEGLEMPWPFSCDANRVRGPIWLPRGVISSGITGRSFKRLEGGGLYVD